MLVEIQLYVMLASLNGLKVQDFADEPKSEFIAQNFGTFVKVYDLVVTQSVITQQFMQYQLQSNEEYVRFSWVCCTQSYE